jgi:hypothetical protein
LVCACTARSRLISEQRAQLGRNRPTLAIRAVLERR